MPKRGKVLHKEDRKNSVGRLLFVIVAVIIQIIWFWFFLYYLTESYLWASIFAKVLAAVMVLGVFSKRSNASIKMTWIFIIMAFPILGVLLYRSGGCHALSLSGSVPFDFGPVEERK